MDTEKKYFTIGEKDEKDINMFDKGLPKHSR